MPTAKQKKHAAAYGMGNQSMANMLATPQLTADVMQAQYGDELGAKIWAAYEKEVLKPNQQAPVIATPVKISSAKAQFKKRVHKMNKADKRAFKRTLSGSASMPVTQKARGIRRLEHIVGYAGHDTMRAARYVALLPYQFHEFAPGSLAPPAFARPCPVRPRHGFVESRQVDNARELLGVFQEATAADPEAEVMVMERLTGNFSAVITDSGITYGTGHDGVTAHGERLWRVPTPGGFDDFVYDGETIKESGYMECVENWGELTAVQLRDGPKPPRALVNYIPEKDYKVTALFDATPYMDDLLEWERVAKGLIPGTLVIAPNCSLSSHVVVHCIAHKIAVATEAGFEARVGDVVQPEAATPPALTDADYQRIAGYMHSLFTWNYIATAAKPSRSFKRDWPLLSLLQRGESSTKTFRVHIQSLATMLGTLHAMSTWGNEDHLLRLRAFGAVTLVKFLTAACLGEARHFYAYGPGAKTGETAQVPWNELLEQFGLSKSSMRDHRDYVYQAGLGMGREQLGVTLDQCVVDFGGPWCRMSDRDYSNYRRYGNVEHGCSYGGPKWRDSAKLTRELFKRVVAFMDKPCHERWAAVVSQYNVAVNAMHNGGPLLSKWCEVRTFDNAARVPVMFFGNSVAMRVICSDGVNIEAPKGDLVGWTNAAETEWKRLRLMLCFSNKYADGYSVFKLTGLGSKDKWEVPALFVKWRMQNTSWGNGMAIYKNALKLWGKRSSSGSGE